MWIVHNNNVLFLLAYDNAVRSQRLRTELSQTKKEINSYLDSVERNKVKQAITQRKRKLGKLKDVSTYDISMIARLDNIRAFH